MSVEESGCTWKHVPRSLLDTSKNETNKVLFGTKKRVSFTFLAENLNLAKNVILLNYSFFCYFDEIIEN